MLYNFSEAIRFTIEVNYFTKITQRKNMTLEDNVFIDSIKNYVDDNEIYDCINNFLTLEETAKCLNVTTRTIRLWEKLNKIKPIPDMKGLNFYKSDIQRLVYCAGKEIHIERRPVNVFFDTLRKPPEKIKYLGYFEIPDNEFDDRLSFCSNLDLLKLSNSLKIDHNKIKKIYKNLETYTYESVSANEAKTIYEKSIHNGWHEADYQDLKLIDKEYTEIPKIVYDEWYEADYQDLKLTDKKYQEISIGNKNYILPSIDKICMWQNPKIIKPNFLDSSTMILETSDNLFELNKNSDELEINACPPFIIFYYYDIVENEIKLCKKMYQGYVDYFTIELFALYLKYKLKISN